MVSCTFHVPFALEDDEGVAAAAVLLVPDYPYPLYRAVVFELASEVFFSERLVLY